MADDIQVTPGSGATVSFDDLGAKKVQRVKIQFGTDGNATDVSATDPLPVTLDAVGEASYDPLTTKAYSFFTASHQVVGLIDSGTAREVNIWNDTDANMIGSWDGGTTDHFIVPSRSNKTVPFAALGVGESTDLWMKYASAPTTGNVYFEVIK